MKKKNFFGTLLLVLTLTLAACSTDAAPNETNDDIEENTEEVIEDVTEDITEDVTEDVNVDEVDEVEVSNEFSSFDQFIDVDMGMTIQEVETLLGAPMSTSTIDSMGTELTTKMWMDINLFNLSSSVTVTFSDEVVTSVLQTSDSSSNVTADDYTQISSGMSEAEVYAILGAPYSIMVSELMGIVSTTVSWINADFSSITITFSNGNVSSSMTSNLN